MTSSARMKKAYPSRAILLGLSAIALVGGLWLYGKRDKQEQALPVVVTPTSATPATAEASPVTESVPTMDMPLWVVNPNLLDLELLADGKTAIAVGTEGTILRSEDDGKSYRRIDSGTREYLAKLLVERATGSILVIGSGGTLLRSDDEGNRFERVPLTESVTLSAIAQSESTNRIVFVGDSGVAYASDDDGHTFTKEATGVASYLAELMAIRGKQGRFVAGGDNGALLVREKEGRWRDTKVTEGKFVTALRVLPDGVVLVGLQDGRLLRSADEGDHWGEVQRTQPDHYAVGFDSSDNGEIVIVRARKEPLLLSTNAGRTFEKLDYSPTPGTSPLAWLDGQGFVGLAGNRGILRSDPTGRVWDVATSKHPALAAKVIVNPRTRTLLAVGHSGFVGRSTDRGKTLELVHPDLGGLIRSIARDPKTDVIVGVGLDTTLVRSTDGGKTYARLPITVPPQAELSAVTFEPKTAAFVAATTEGHILRSTDGGRSFSQQTTLSKSVFELLSLGDRRLLALCSELGAQISLDGGQHFRSAMPQVQATLRHAQRLGNPATLLAMGDQGVLFRSTDGGASFQAVTSPSPNNLRKSDFEAQTNRLWLVGDRGTVLVSDDLATTFRIVPVPTEENLFSVGSTENGDTVFIGGNGGILLRSDDHGKTFTTIPTGSFQPIRVTQLDPSSGQFVIAGVGGLLMRTTDNKTPRRVRGRFEGRFDQVLFHEPTRTMVIAGDRLLRLGGN
jgi:photosystem II stability/assembly factor-like uncharacterized protein